MNTPGLPSNKSKRIVEGPDEAARAMTQLDAEDLINRSRAGAALGGKLPRRDIKNLYILRDHNAVVRRYLDLWHGGYFDSFEACLISLVLRLAKHNEQLQAAINSASGPITTTKEEKP